MAVCAGCGLQVIAGQLNLHLKPGGGLSCSDAGLSATFTASTAYVDAGETTTSTAYTDLATVGPSVTIVTGTSALVFIDAELFIVDTGSAKMSVAVSGASTIGADDNRALVNPAVNTIAAGFMALYVGLTAGSNTFTAKYKTQTAGTVQFGRRRLVVVP
jgi:hypothetical protein